jgi:hypothetical protein
LQQALAQQSAPVLQQSAAAQAPPARAITANKVSNAFFISEILSFVNFGVEL